MPSKEIIDFSVKRLEILDAEGNCDRELRPNLSDEQVKEIYRYMVLGRAFDDRAIKLQRQGRLGTYAPLIGHEAVQVASAYALEEGDWMVPSHRGSVAYFVRGVPLRNLFMFWGGDERGMRIPEKLNILPITVPVGTHIPHAVGIAWGAKMKGDKVAVLCYLGDGATSKADFHEGLNFAGVFKVPAVFLIENNQYAISVPRWRQTAAETLAQKAFAYGFAGIQVDGNDVFAVYKATKEALDKARQGGGPTLIEAELYRLGDHTTADDATRYRTAEEVERWRRKDPILRLRKYMEKEGIWSEDDELRLRKEVDELVDEAVEEYESVPPQSPEDIFRYTYAEMPWNLKEQMDELLTFLREKEAEKKPFKVERPEGGFP